MVEFRKAVVPQEIKALCDFDRRAFHRHPQDLFDPEDWDLFESYWVVADGQVVGCTVLMHDVDYNEEPRPGCLYIVSTGVLPEFQRKGVRHTAEGLANPICQESRLHHNRDEHA